jgi:polyhydroxyalkanoate synthase subunit PhaC
MAQDSSQEPVAAARGFGFEVQDPQRFAQNMGRLVEETAKAVAAYVQPRLSNPAEAFASGDLSRMMNVFSKIQGAWLVQPQKFAEAQLDLWQRYLKLWTSALTGTSQTEPVAVPDAKDARFKDPAWSQNQYFDFMKQAYLINSRWAEHLVEGAEDVDADTRHKAGFYMKQVMNALAPSNWVFTNPELLRETFASDGENLVRGMQLLAEDIKIGGGDLRIRQTDFSKFEVGRNLAITSGKVIFQNELLQLIQYEATTDTVLKRPLLIVPPWINKFYILDLTPEKSFIKWAMSQGHTVFVVSWVNPDERLARKTFEDYMRQGVFEAINAVCDATGEEGINALGYCVGGTLVAVALAVMRASGDNRVRSVTFFTAQVDFKHAGDLKVFSDEEQIKSIEREMEEKGYLDSKKMRTVFNLLRSNDLIWPYIVNVYQRGKEPLPFDLLFWNSDSTRMPAANHSFYLRHCYLQNDLAEGRLEMGGERVDLRKIDMPIYELAAREDHIAPAKSVFVGASLFGGNVRFVLAGSGHIAGVINPPGPKVRYQHWTGDAPGGELEAWIERAQEHPGSWWPDWQAWIEALDNERVPARGIGSGKLAPVEDAPGSYVRVKG